MSQDVKLLPLPAALTDAMNDYGEQLVGEEVLIPAIRDYARANMEPLITENERLQAEVARQESLKEKYIFQSDGWEYKDRASEVRAERLESRCHALAEALRWITSNDTARDANDGMEEVETIKYRARVALHDHEKEEGNG